MKEARGQAGSRERGQGFPAIQARNAGQPRGVCDSHGCGPDTQAGRSVPSEGGKDKERVCVQWRSSGQNTLASFCVHFNRGVHMRFKQGQEWSPDIHIPARLTSTHPHSLPPPRAKDPASTGPQQRGLLLPHAPSHVDGGGGEVAVPSGLRQHAAGVHSGLCSQR